jgi:hypothetical protein
LRKAPVSSIVQSGYLVDKTIGVEYRSPSDKGINQD